MKHPSSTPRIGGFTLLEVALILAIIGMMLLMIVGYLFAPKNKGTLPPVAAFTPIPSESATRAPGATPAQSIDLKPQSAPTFR